MATLYTHKDKNIRKTWAFVTFFLIGIIFLGYVVSYLYGEPGILVIAVMYAVGSSFVSYWWSDKIALAMSGAKKVDEKSAPGLVNTVQNLAMTAGLPMPRVFVIPDPGMNAFTTGRNPEHAAVAVTTGLMEALDQSELEGVIAHELSHIGNRDILLSTIVVVLVGTVTLMSDLFFRFRLFGGGRRDSNSGGGPIALIGLALLILAPIAAMFIQLVISRKREYLADATGSLLTRYPEGLANALRKISTNSSVRRAGKSTAHLFIAAPLRRGFVTRIFSTHPPVEKRIEALLEGGNVRK